MLNMQTEEFESQPGVVRPADNFTAIRMTRDVTEGMTLGGFYFGRESDGAVAYNRVAGFDVLAQPSRTLRIEAFGMESSTEGVPSDFAGRAGLSYDANTNRAHLFHLNVGDRFRHDLGFVRRNDVGLTFAKYERILRPRAGSRWVREHSFGAALELVQDSGYQEVQTRVNGLAYDVRFQDGGQFALSYDATRERLNEPFAIRDAIVIPSGDYDFGEARVRYQSNESAPFSGEVSSGKGRFGAGLATPYREP
jgi:hypothetical protein